MAKVSGNIYICKGGGTNENLPANFTLLSGIIWNCSLLSEWMYYTHRFPSLYYWSLHKTVIIECVFPPSVRNVFDASGVEVQFAQIWRIVNSLHSVKYSDKVMTLIKMKWKLMRWCYWESVWCEHWDNINVSQKSTTYFNHSLQLLFIWFFKAF